MRDKNQEIMYLLLSLLSFGLLPLFCVWYPKFYTLLTKTRILHLRDAEYVLLLGLDQTWTEIKVNSMLLNDIDLDASSPVSQIDQIALYFDYKKQRYIYKESQGLFLRQNGILKGNCNSILLKKGYTTGQVEELQKKHGLNVLDIDMPELPKMILDKVLHPFYIFQFFSIMIWIYTDYVTFSFIIFASTLVSISNEIYLARKSISDLKNLLPPTEMVYITRDSNTVRLDASELVIGDVVILESWQNTPCDLVLIQGECIMDESALTGESVPVVKTPLASDTADFKMDRFKSNVLFAGSKVIQFKGDNTNPNETRAFAVVISTGFSTSKGELFRSLLFPKHIQFKFNQDSYKFLMILGIVALGVFINRVIQGLQKKTNLLDVLLSSADLITIAVPPALPLVLTIGIVLSMERLKKMKIFCISPPRINFAGRIDTMCWDKTGTLTSSQLVFSGADTVIGGALSGLKENYSRDMELVLASCHGVNIVNGSTVGHPLDIEMMNASCRYIHKYMHIMKHISACSF